MICENAYFPNIPKIFDCQKSGQNESTKTTDNMNRSEASQTAVLN